MPRNYRKKLLHSGFNLALTLLLMLLARLSPGFAEWYGRTIFPLFPQILGRMFSWLPFSLAELLLLALVIAALVRLLLSLFALFSTAGRARLRAGLPKLGLELLSAFAGLLLMFTLACGLNYQRDSIAVYVGLETRPSSGQELRRLYDVLVRQAFELVPQSECDSEGELLMPRTELHREARAGMRQLSGRYDGLASYYPQPKPLLFSEGMSWLNLSGIYSPFTIEANYNNHMPALLRPFAVCHELAHLGGYSREDEANFIAYLACEQSGDNSFRYSGNFQELIYVLNALQGVLPPDEYSRLYRQLPVQTRIDMGQVSAYWQNYEGRAAQVSENVNDAYLKANSQPDGVQSYGRMVDLLLAYYIR